MEPASRRWQCRPTEYEEAQKLLLDSLKEEYQIDTEENHFDAYFEVNEDHTYAKLTTQFFDHDDVMEIRVGNVYHHS